jgi:hydroxymethylbilane synthase
VKVIKTSADNNPTESIRSGSSIGIFVKEIEQSLLKKEIDLAVHSMKDLPSQLPVELEIAAVPEREDARDVFISLKAKSLFELEPNSTIGTGSMRRQSQLLALRPDLKILDIRGNIDSRIKKLKSGAYDAVILARAGLNRLGLQNEIAEIFGLDKMLSAPGQGALAIEIRKSDELVAPIAAALNHAPSFYAVLAERAFLRRMGGGCNVPIAAYAKVQGDSIEIEGLVASPNGSAMVRDKTKTSLPLAEKASVDLADAILARGGAAILNSL